MARTVCPARAAAAYGRGGMFGPRPSRAAVRGTTCSTRGHTAAVSGEIVQKELNLKSKEHEILIIIWDCLVDMCGTVTSTGTNGRLMQITQSLSSSAPSKDEFFSRTARATLSRSESRTRAATAALQIKIQTQIPTQTQTQTHGWCGNQVENAWNGPSPCGSVPQGPPGLYLQASRCSFQWARLREFVWVWCQCVALSESWLNWGNLFLYTCTYLYQTPKLFR